MLHMEMVHVGCGVGGCVDILGGDILPMHTMCTYPFSSHTIPRCIHLVGGVLAGTGTTYQAPSHVVVVCTTCPQPLCSQVLVVPTSRPSYWEALAPDTQTTGLHDILEMTT